MNELGESRDLKQERDSEAYQAMYAKVEEEMYPTTLGWGYTCHQPDGRRVHAEAMRRLKAANEEI